MIPDKLPSLAHQICAVDTLESILGGRVKIDSAFSSYANQKAKATKVNAINSSSSASTSSFSSSSSSIAPMSAEDRATEKTTEESLRIEDPAATTAVAEAEAEAEAVAADFAITTSATIENDTTSVTNLNSSPSLFCQTSSHPQLLRPCASKKIEVEKEVVDPWSYHFKNPKDFFLVYSLAGILPKEKEKEKETEKENDKDKEKNKEKNMSNDKKNEKASANVDKQIVSVDEENDVNMMKICNLLTLKNSVANVTKNVFEFISNNFCVKNENDDDNNNNNNNNNNDVYNDNNNDNDVYNDVYNDNNNDNNDNNDNNNNNNNNNNNSNNNDNNYLDMTLENEVIMSSDEIDFINEANSNKINKINKNKNKNNNNRENIDENKMKKLLFCSVEELEKIFENQGFLLYNLTKEHSKEGSSAYREKLMQNCFFCFERG